MRLGWTLTSVKLTPSYFRTIGQHLAWRKWLLDQLVAKYYGLHLTRQMPHQQRRTKIDKMSNQSLLKPEHALEMLSVGMER